MQGKLKTPFSWLQKFCVIASPADKNLSSIKIKLDNIKDIYNLPNEINIDDIYPGKYKLIELKYPDNQTIYY